VAELEAVPVTIPSPGFWASHSLSVRLAAELPRRPDVWARPRQARLRLAVRWAVVGWGLHDNVVANANSGPEAYYGGMSMRGAYDLPTIQANPNGGAAPYTYSWYWDPAPASSPRPPLPNRPSHPAPTRFRRWRELGREAPGQITDATGATAVCQFYINMRAS
jgi:hypothetical protein